MPRPCSGLLEPILCRSSFTTVFRRLSLHFSMKINEHGRTGWNSDGFLKPFSVSRRGLVEALKERYANTTQEPGCYMVPYAAPYR